MNQELSDVQARFRKDTGTRDQVANIHWIIEKAREFQKYLLLHWLPENLWLCGSQQSGKFLKRLEYQTNLSVFWETCMQVKKKKPVLVFLHVLVRNRHGTMDWLIIGKGVCQVCIKTPYLFNFYAEVVFSLQSCPTLCNPMDCSIQGFPVPHYLLESAQVNLHCISDAIQPSHLMLLLVLPSLFPSIRDFSNESSVHIR